MAAKAALDPLEALIRDAEKKYNGLRVGTMDSVAEGVVAITSGNLAIDYAIGVGGFPIGRNVELSGPPSCGKTTTALQTAAAMQKIIKAGGGTLTGPDGNTVIIGPNDMIIYFDYEQAMDKKYANALGLDTSHSSLLFTQPDTLEDGVNFAIAAVKTGRVRLVIFDSVAAMLPSAKAEAEIGKSLPMVQAKLLKDFSSIFNSVLYNHNTLAIFLNHEQEKISMGGGGRPGMPPPTTTPGGTAMKYFASVRVQYRQIRQNKGPFIDPLTMETTEIVTSTDVRVKVIKNKVAPPFRQAVVRVRFGKGFDNFWTALQVLLANKKIMYSAGMFYFHNLDELGLAPEWMARAGTGTHRPYIKGESKVFALGDKYPEWRAALITLAEEIVAANAEAMDAVVPTGEDEPDSEEDELGMEIDTATGEVKGHTASFK